MKKIIVFVPIEAKEKIKLAMFDCGAGAIGNYDRCCFETRGVGQFRPLAGSNPFCGERGKIEFVDEVKLEMVCENHQVVATLAAMKEVHPYEEVAFEVYDLLSF